MIESVVQALSKRRIRKFYEEYKREQERIHVYDYIDQVQREKVHDLMSSKRPKGSRGIALCPSCDVKGVYRAKWKLYTGTLHYEKCENCHYTKTLRREELV